jgi:protein ImuB
MQPGLWGELGEADARARRALVRVQGMLGPEAVVTAVIGGGRGYADRVRLVAWGDETEPRSTGGDERSPGRGRCALARSVARARTRDRAGPSRPRPPCRPSMGAGGGDRATGHDRRAGVGGGGGGRPVEVTAWAGPWPADERWWAPEEATRLVRFQVGWPTGGCC